MSENKQTQEEKIILFDSEEAAKYVTNITGWVSKDGRFWGTDERAARYDGCTHVKCECGNITEKGWLKCDSCRHKADIEKYNSFPFREWDKKEPVYSYAADKYFFEESDLEEYCDEEEVDPKDLRLVLCNPNYLSEVELDGAELPEDTDLEDVVDKELLAMVAALNDKIRQQNPISYCPGRTRTEYVPNSIQSIEQSQPTD